MSFCPMNASALEGDPEEELTACFDLFNTAFDCVMISNPFDYLMESGWFYDNNFHLNTAGAQVRTFHLAQDLLAQWGCYEAVEMEMPEMPAPMAGKAAADTADSGYFTFEEQGEGYMLTGLTEQGRKQAALHLPAAYLGKSVEAISADALLGADLLEEIRIPGALQALPGGLFSGCPNLKRLILEHTEAPCRIVSHELDALPSLKILVPSEAYSLYRDGVGCGENPWQPYLNRIAAY